MDDKHKQFADPKTEAEYIIKSIFEGEPLKIKTDPDCKVCGGNGIQKTIKTFVGEMITTTYCPSCKIESKPVGTQSKIRKLYSVVLKFIAGKKSR